MMKSGSVIRILDRMWEDFIRHPFKTDVEWYLKGTTTMSLQNYMDGGIIKETDLL